MPIFIIETDEKLWGPKYLYIYQMISEVCEWTYKGKINYNYSQGILSIASVKM